MLTIVMCDDDIGFLQQLYDRTEEIMQKLGIEYSIKEFDNGRETVAYCRENGADMILADIDMPDKSGFEAIRELQEQQPEVPVIFVSSHEELAYQSFRYNPFQFVSKSEPERLEAVLTTLVKRMGRSRESLICIETESGMVDINVDRVMYLQSDRNYIIGYDEDEIEVIRFRGILKNVYDALSGAGFIYTHKRYVINCRFIRRFERKKVILDSGREISGTRNTEMIDEAQRVYGSFMRRKRWR